jgi:hypothetical protein
MFIVSSGISSQALKPKNKQTETNRAADEAFLPFQHNIKMIHIAMKKISTPSGPSKTA